MTSSATELLGLEIYHRLISNELPGRLDFIEYRPEWEGFFGDAATRLKCSNQSNDSVIEAIEWLASSGMVVFTREPDETRSQQVPRDQPYPERFKCTIELR